MISFAHTIIRHLGLSLLIVSAIGCASSDKKHLQQSEFRTKISTKKLKHFELSIERGSYVEKKILSRPNSKNPQKRAARISKSMRKLVDVYLEKNQYCRTGFWVIETHSYKAGLQLRGECHELATAEDMHNFPNTVNQW
ncbi:MAG: hypothetical protein K6L80_13145 [Agarilytica sp.]